MKLTKDNDGPFDGYNGDICDNGEHEVAGKSHTSCTLSNHCPVTITVASHYCDQPSKNLQHTHSQMFSLTSKHKCLCRLTELSAEQINSGISKVKI